MSCDSVAVSNLMLAWAISEQEITQLLSPQIISTKKLYSTKNVPSVAIHLKYHHKPWCKFQMILMSCQSVAVAIYEVLNFDWKKCASTLGRLHELCKHQ